MKMMPAVVRTKMGYIGEMPCSCTKPGSEPEQHSNYSAVAQRCLAAALNQVPQEEKWRTDSWSCCQCESS
jgi:hypothetical protein